ncbi:MULTISPECIES: phosphate ABC transporter ATP-binding protein PstB [Arthrospira]|uniref:Phosphate transport system ATP-binding protein n=1 Tax=Limnospira platensis NIES-46 TaxID=1236695 RepID=A0A5M3T9G7_LIMPL|nr:MULTISPECIES: phosphate ABC transporter ATP-binding protein PstB [Arthrospira]MBD2669553.1 phosphate ABC transporter ATP-binding protein [Arthrospira platensis FACHB-439]MBD2712169.1 phosphate ABC transporter ATP-binding protein [Arthrospira platensis FACHB-835]MDF2211837.1 phosphate ABC transporter ATP-binding protein PstB [Arthrospira platensis NCB002]MDT9184433.1 phosphate ABC transporter ATP-binding protein PstB [Limnospira sp. PMC 289.06]MDT9296649.1 phosphate ABC transporter ATP-bindi
MMDASIPDTANLTDTDIVIHAQNLDVFYGDFKAVRGVTMDILKKRVTAFIGPSGCGKTTILRCFNRINDLIPGFRLSGNIYYQGQNLYDPIVDPVQVRRQIGMVFQKPNPFPKSIYENIAYGVRVNGLAKSKGDMDEIVERSLRQAVLWDEVKDKLRQSGLALSGGQQQRLCIARAVSVQPDVILMDEPCSALDPISTMRIEELIVELKQQYTIIIVTHNMQQATRVADMTAFFNAKAEDGSKRFGYLVEFSDTHSLFQNPQQEATQQYVSGRFG